MPHPLTSAQLKFDRACEHVDCLHKAVRDFLSDKETYRVLDQYEPETGGYARYLEAAKTPPQFSLLIGDAAHNFRSCLDHIAWQLAIAASPTGNPYDDVRDVTKIAFPIFVTRRKYLRERHKHWRHVGIRPEHRRIVRNLQPYKRRDAPETHPLWHLYWL